jgi:hypothetical protein
MAAARSSNSAASRGGQTAVTRYDYVRTRREDVKPLPKQHMGLVRAFLKIFTRINVWVYVATGGHEGSARRRAGRACVTL